MTSTYEKIATTTLGSDAATVTFSSISGSYTDLVLIAKASQDGSVGSISLRFNSDTGSNYSLTRMFGDGSAASTAKSSNETAGGVVIIGNSAVSSAGTYIINIMNYSNSTTYKTCISRGSDASSGGYISAYATLWRSTSAITSIDLKFGAIGGTTNARSGSTFTLYGIKAE
jgi:hypothetical protein